MKKPGYTSTHEWVARHFGQPITCEHCNNQFAGRKIQWANKSGTYKRERSDWLRLCAKCHHQFDLEIHTKAAHSPETQAKRTLAMKLRRHSAETRLRMSIAAKKRAQEMPWTVWNSTRNPRLRKDLI